ncbi:MAG: Urease operon transcriptional activator [Pseudomonadota bacterium]|jgi:AraC-like DNA-binding protein
MNDFASAAMMRLIGAGMRRQGLLLRAPPSGRAAHVPLQDKRALLAQLWQSHGPGALLRIGEAVNDLPEEPTLIALALARDPLDLLARWQKLERFVHSRHRVVIESSAAGQMSARHVSLDQTQAPHAAEDLLIFGLLVVLMERIGAADVKARAHEAQGWMRLRGQWQGDGSVEATDTWHIVWQPSAAAPRAEKADGQDLAGLIAAVRERLFADPGRAWTVQSLADELALSKRTLQRQLAASGQSFRDLVAQARLARSARLLSSSRMSPSEIGYVCGFSDQAHFTREFKRSTAFTPALYRAEFAATQ